MHAKASSIIFHKDTEVVILKSQDGDPSGPVLFAMSIQSILRELQPIELPNLQSLLA